MVTTAQPPFLSDELFMMDLESSAGKVIGYPLPRTGTSYSVDGNCPLLKYNLTYGMHAWEFFLC